MLGPGILSVTGRTSCTYLRRTLLPLTPRVPRRHAPQTAQDAYPCLLRAASERIGPYLLSRHAQGEDSYTLVQPPTVAGILTKHTARRRYILTCTGRLAGRRRPRVDGSCRAGAYRADRYRSLVRPSHRGRRRRVRGCGQELCVGSPPVHIVPLQLMQC